MVYEVKVAICPEVRTKHINAMWVPYRISECQSWWYIKKSQGFKRMVSLILREVCKKKNIYSLMNLEMLKILFLTTENRSTGQSLKRKYLKIVVKIVMKVGGCVLYTNGHWWMLCYVLRFKFCFWVPKVVDQKPLQSLCILDMNKLLACHIISSFNMSW